MMGIAAGQKIIFPVVNTFHVPRPHEWMNQKGEDFTMSDEG